MVKNCNFWGIIYWHKFFFKKNVHRSLDIKTIPFDFLKICLSIIHSFLVLRQTSVFFHGNHSCHGLIKANFKTRISAIERTQYKYLKKCSISGRVFNFLRRRPLFHVYRMLKHSLYSSSAFPHKVQ